MYAHVDETGVIPGEYLVNIELGNIQCYGKVGNYNIGQFVMAYVTFWHYQSTEDD